MSVLRKFIFAFLLPIILILSRCTGAYRDDPRLQRIEKALNEQNIEEEKALSLRDSLQSIPDSELREGERQYKALLFIKASDKAYVTHTSDSLYLTVHHYFSSHNKEVLPEVLYYGGRVYSDIGDYPTALKYFQEALDATDESRKNLNLRRRILAQTGGLLDKLCLYDQALGYVEKSISIDSILCDTLTWVYDLELAGGVLTRLKSHERAKRLLQKAMSLSDRKYPQEHAFSRFRYGYSCYKEGDTTRSISIFRSTADSVDRMDKNYVLPIISQAYLEAGKPDSAVYYARRLVENPDTLNKMIGYSVLLSEPCRRLIPSDTLELYIDAYASMLEARKDRSMQEAAMIQQGLYNYSLHVEQQRKAEKERDSLLILFWVMLSGVLAIGCVIAIIRYRKTKEKNELGSGVIGIIKKENVRTDHPRFEAKKIKMVEGTGTEKTPPRESSSDFIAKILKMYEESQGRVRKYEVPETIKSHETFAKITEWVREEMVIEDDRSAWSEVRDMVDSVFPEFMTNLSMCCNQSLSRYEEQTALLIKCGIRQRDIAILSGRTKGGIGSRRDSISKKIFGENKGAKITDWVIRNL